MMISASSSWNPQASNTSRRDVAKESTVTKGRSAQKRVAIYLHVPTGEQTTDNQRRELEEVAAPRLACG
jgi:hypothetical protein